MNFSESQLRGAFFGMLEEMKEELFINFIKKIKDEESDVTKKVETKSTKKDAVVSKPKPKPAPKKPAAKPSVKKEEDLYEKIMESLEKKAGAFKTQSYYNVQTNKIHTKSPAMMKKYVFYSGGNLYIAAEEDSKELENIINICQEKGIELEKVEVKKPATTSVGTKVSATKKPRESKLPKIIRPKADKHGRVVTADGFVVDTQTSAVIGMPESDGTTRPLTRVEKKKVHELGYRMHEFNDEEEREKVTRSSLKPPNEEQEIILEEDDEETDKDEMHRCVDEAKKVIESNSNKKNKKMKDEAEKEQQELDEIDEESDHESEDEHEKEDYLKIIKYTKQNEVSLSNTKKIGEGTKLTIERIKELFAKKEKLNTKYIKEITGMSLDLKSKQKILDRK